MRQEIIEFYKNKGFELTKLYRAKPTNITNIQIQAAAHDLYWKIHGGLEIKDINIGRRIFEIAKTIEYKEFAKDQHTLEHSKEIISKLRDQRFWAYMIAFCSISAFSAALVYILGGF